jgi:hypothetical protein
MPISSQAYSTDIPKESGLNINYIEKKWDEAKTITKEDMNNKEESEWTNNEWNYCKGVLKSMLGIKENLLNKFLNSKYSAKEFFNECVKPLKEEVELVKHDDGYIYTQDSHKFIIYPNGNQWILQIDGENKLKGSLAVLKGGIKDFLNEN